MSQPANGHDRAPPDELGARRRADRPTDPAPFGQDQRLTVTALWAFRQSGLFVGLGLGAVAIAIVLAAWIGG